MISSAAKERLFFAVLDGQCLTAASEAAGLTPTIAERTFHATIRAISRADWQHAPPPALRRDILQIRAQRSYWAAAARGHFHPDIESVDALPMKVRKCLLVEMIRTRSDARQRFESSLPEPRALPGLGRKGIALIDAWLKAKDEPGWQRALAQLWEPDRNAISR